MTDIRALVTKEEEQVILVSDWSVILILSSDWFRVPRAPAPDHRGAEDTEVKARLEVSDAGEFVFKGAKVLARMSACSGARLSPRLWRSVTP